MGIVPSRPARLGLRQRERTATKMQDLVDRMTKAAGEGDLDAVMSLMTQGVHPNMRDVRCGRPCGFCAPVLSAGPRARVWNLL